MPWLILILVRSTIILIIQQCNNVLKVSNFVQSPFLIFEKPLKSQFLTLSKSREILMKNSEASLLCIALAVGTRHLGG